jgi:carbamoyltransferase
MYNILGLNFGHDASAAILKEGKLVCAISNERISRKKKAAGVTKEMIDYILEVAELKVEEIQFIAYSGFMPHKDNHVKIFDTSGNEATQPIFDVTGPQTVIDTVAQIGNLRFKSAFVHHHMSHAASAFYTSPFERAACFTMDASQYRPEACSLFAYGEGNKLHYLMCPGLMIGNAYSNFTQKLGIGNGLFKAGTTMALASYGTPPAIALEKWEYYGKSFYAREDQRADTTFIDLMWSELSGLPPHAEFPKEKSDSKEAMNIAAGMEHIFEQTILKAANELYERTKSYNDGNLCLSGGSFLNSNANMLIKREAPFKNVHLFNGCGDDGAAVGAAMYVAHHFADVKRVKYEPREYMYLGRSYPTPPDGGQPYNAREVAVALAEGRIIAFFHGGSEFGPRALGHRSLFADPRNPKMKEILNSRVKHREWYRPFAPIVLSEKAREWFDIDFETKLMLFIAPIRQPDRIPAVAHVDGSARLQTMTREDNPKVYELIEEFDRITGVPIILNTSLNDNGEPLVESPEDAINFFKKNDVDLLVLEDRVFGRGEI